MLIPILFTFAFAIFLIALVLWKPYTARIVLGIFFLLMALGVNVTILLTDPSLYVAAGANALLPVYRWFFTTVLAWNPVFFTVLLILFETSVGILILSKGRAVRLGLAGGILFCLWLTPVGIEELSTPLIALALALLLRHSFDRSPFDRFTGARQTARSGNGL